MDKFIIEVKEKIKGEIVRGEDEIKYSRDTSIFEMQPSLVICPKDSEDIQNLISIIKHNKKEIPNLSLTARCAGTDMTGGPLTESVLIDFTKYMNNFLELGVIGRKLNQE